MNDIVLEGEEIKTQNDTLHATWRAKKEGWDVSGGGGGGGAGKKQLPPPPPPVKPKLVLQIERYISKSTAIELTVNN